jgi:hypothetical protein
MAEYELWLTSDTGRRIQLIDDATHLVYSRKANDIGWLRIQLPATFDDKLLKPDRMIQVWRQPAGGTLALWRPYFIRRWQFMTIDGEDTLAVWGQDPNVILSWRLVAYYAGESESTKTGNAGDLMKSIVDENMLATAPTAREYTTYVTKQVDLSDGASLTRSFAWRNVLEVCQELSEGSREAATDIFFDMQVSNVGGDSISFEFRTFTNHIGVDRTTGSKRVIFDQERGNMRNPSLEYDYTEEANYVYVLGQGHEGSREQNEVSDSTAGNVSFWGRKEGYADGRLETSTTGLQDIGRAKLRQMRRRIYFAADPMDTKGTRFGREWNFGDKVTARYRGIEVEPIISSVQVEVSDGAERINARLEYED